MYMQPYTIWWKDLLMTKMINIEAEFKNNDVQKKSFKDEKAAMEWCRRNYKKIFRINDRLTLFEPISHFDIIDAIRKNE